MAWQEHHYIPIFRHKLENLKSPWHVLRGKRFNILGITRVQYNPSYCVIPYLPISYREVEMQLLSKFLLLLRLLPWRITMGNAETLQNLSKKMQPSFAQPIPAPLKALFPSQPDSNQYLEKMCKIRSHNTAGDIKQKNVWIFYIHNRLLLWQTHSKLLWHSSKFLTPMIRSALLLLAWNDPESMNSLLLTPWRGWLISFYFYFLLR